MPDHSQPPLARPEQYRAWERLKPLDETQELVQAWADRARVALGRNHNARQEARARSRRQRQLADYPWEHEVPS